MDSKTIIFLVLGLILLLASGKFLVESSVTIARHFKIPSGIIGLTIVAFGTSAPELLVSLQAAIQGHPDMALGNVVGSNISNILLVLGITTIIFPLVVHRNSILRDWPILIVISLILGLFLLDLYISRLEGVLFLILLIAYLVFSI
ncbi:MAG: sodium:calcium antiporter, partial [Bacteroidales bacterium]|nr:sodium:calcium antiporter [Bacteroidales bacterium]